MNAVPKTISDPYGFEHISIAKLESLTSDEIDQLPFSVVGLAASGTVEVYNEAEAQRTGKSKRDVRGRSYFGDVAKCMNRHHIALRLNNEAQLDETIDCVLTLNTKVMPAKVRLLCRPQSRLKYVLVQRMAWPHLAVVGR